MSASIEPTSRWVVGSSISRRFGGSSNNLTSAIRADQYRALTALGLILQPTINNQIAVGMIDIFQRDHAQTAPHRLREMKLDRLSARDRRGDFFHPIDLFQFALRLRRFARLGS